MLPRKRLEIGFADLLRGLAGCFRRLDRTDLRSTLEAHWSAGHASAVHPSAAHPTTDGQGFACLSVRTALDLYLAARAFPAGSEVLMTGANIPDMARVVRAHDLVPVAIDFDLRDLAPSVDAIAAHRTDRSRALIFAHLFGGIVPLDAIAGYCADHGLDLVEDCAQAFCGPGFRGHPGALLSLFSFGPIKSATALGGALATVRDASLRRRMRAIESTWPVATRADFLRRLLKYSGIAILTRELPYTILSTVARRTGGDLDRWVGQAARSFPGDQILTQLRRQPGAALLALLLHRQRGARAEHYRQRAALGLELAEALGDATEIPGADLERHSFWVFPILTDNPEALVRTLRSAGFDATRRATLAPLGPRLPRLESTFSRLVYLPFDLRYSRSAIHRMAEEVRASQGTGRRGKMKS